MEKCYFCSKKAITLCVDCKKLLCKNHKHTSYGKDRCKSDYIISNGKVVNNGVINPSKPTTEIIIDSTQYSILNVRRDSFNNLLWNTPIITLMALSFLFSIMFSSKISSFDLLIVSILAFFVSIFSMQLLSKHRFYEKRIAQILEYHEETSENMLGIINKKFKPERFYTKLSSFFLCFGLLFCFSLSSLYKIIYAVVKIFESFAESGG